MKKFNLILLGAFTVSALFLSSCKDEDPINSGGEETSVSCKLIQLDDNDGFVTAFTYDGDNVVTMTETDSSGTITYNFVYENGELTSINESEGGEWKFAYENGRISRVDVYYDNELDEYSNVKYNADGNPIMIDVYERDGMDDILYDAYEFTWDGNNMTEMKNSYDDDGDGTLESSFTTSFTAFDTKVNPMRSLPLWLMEHDNFFAFSANNVTAGSIDFLGTPVPLTVSYTYDENENPSEISFSFIGEASKLTLGYNCK